MVPPSVRRVETAVRFTTLVPILIFFFLAPLGALADEAPNDETPDDAPLVTATGAEPDPAEDDASDATSVGPVMVTATRAERAILDIAGRVNFPIGIVEAGHCHHAAIGQRNVRGIPAAVGHVFDLDPPLRVGIENVGEPQAANRMEAKGTTRYK